MTFSEERIKEIISKWALFATDADLDVAARKIKEEHDKSTPSTTGLAKAIREQCGVPFDIASAVAELRESSYKAGFLAGIESLSQPNLSRTEQVRIRGFEQHGVPAAELSKRNVDSLERGNNQESQDVKHAARKGLGKKCGMGLHKSCVSKQRCGCSCHRPFAYCHNCKERTRQSIDHHKCSKCSLYGHIPCGDKSCECHKKEEQ